ncbi:enoyl-CoA hydratase/isomerase family protein [Alcaligenaceae bacterium]|nr:enoyl-CoA hydratase/isomerase family protein [Alcaligenaceae bacterium]
MSIDRIGAEGAAPLIHLTDGPVAHVVFNRPGALNAVDIGMAEAFRDAIGKVAADPSVRVLVLRGEGRAFMAGGDVAQMAADPSGVADRIITPLHDGLARMAELPIPVLACLHGAVAGAGMSIALAADLAMAADDVRFQMAYTKIGANPDASGSWHLVRVVGLRKAMELTLLSETVDAGQALSLGLVNWVVPAGELDARSRELAARLADGAVHAFGRSKALLRSAALHDLPTQLEAERRAFLEGAAGAEFKEGADAFLRKRRPEFAAVGRKA